MGTRLSKFFSHQKSRVSVGHPIKPVPEVNTLLISFLLFENKYLIFLAETEQCSRALNAAQSRSVN